MREGLGEGEGCERAGRGNAGDAAQTRFSKHPLGFPHTPSPCPSRKREGSIGAGEDMRGLARLGVGLAALAVLGMGGLYGASEWVLRRSHAVPLSPIAVPHDAASLAEGSRLATLTGCKSCHGDGKGAVWTPVDWREGQVAPPPIARSAARYSDAELARLIRQGVTKEGRTLFVMPAWSMTYLADDDVGRIIAWVRSLKPAPDDVQATTWFGPMEDPDRRNPAERGGRSARGGEATRRSGAVPDAGAMLGMPCAYRGAEP